jgi:serine/threonine protein kinase
MDFIEGQHLGDYAATYPHQRIPETEALILIRPVLDALHYLHTQNPPIVHRDVKPNNIIRTPEGNVYLVDFGLAKRDHGQRQNIATAGFASAGYSAPEQYTQQVDPRADLYSVGATLYTLLSGNVPTSATDRSLALTSNAQKTDPLESLDTDLAGVSANTRAVVKRLLALDPNQRYQTAKDVQHNLQHPVKRQAVPTEPVVPAPKTPAAPNRKQSSQAKPQPVPSESQSSSKATSAKPESTPAQSAGKLGIRIVLLWVVIIGIVALAAWYLLANAPDSQPPRNSTQTPATREVVSPSDPTEPTPAEGEAVLNATSIPECTFYIVQQGDTLGKISVRFGVSVEAIVERNVASYPELLTNPDQLTIDWELCIPQ